MSSSTNAVSATAARIMSNATHNPCLTAHYGSRVRLTAAPPSRATTPTTRWSAGAAEDWCELAPEALGEAERRVRAVGRVLAKQGRLERQASTHTALCYPKLGAPLCPREAPHWPTTEEKG